jgi:hypothetical protein
MVRVGGETSVKARALQGRSRIRSPLQDGAEARISRPASKAERPSPSDRTTHRSLSYFSTRRLHKETPPRRGGVHKAGRKAGAPDERIRPPA